MNDPVLEHRLLFVAAGKDRGFGFFRGRNTAELRPANEPTLCPAAAGAREVAGAQSKSGLCFDFLSIVDCYSYRLSRRPLIVCWTDGRSVLGEETARLPWFPLPVAQ